MSTVPLIPETAPFSPEQRAWLNGFLAGVFSRGPSAVPVQSPTSATLTPLTILFGSQTGTAESLAKRAAKEAGKRGFAATVLDMAQTNASKLGTERNLLVIVSTYGDGEPPDNAKSLWSELGRSSGVSLSQLRFAVCALGDTNYAQFCRCGKDFDERLEKHGAVRIAPRADCDLDYEDAFTRWLDSGLAAFASGSATAPAGPIASLASSENSGSDHADATYSRTRPFPALVLTSRTLNGEGSAKEVRHIEFDLGDSGLTYEAGDALGVVPHNCPELVGHVLNALGCDGEEAVDAPDGSSTSLRHALTAHYDLGKPSPELLAVFTTRAEHSGHGGGAALAAPLHVVDVVEACPELRGAPGAFVKRLKKLQPRLYSISSSPKAHTGQVHLTVGAVRYEAGGRNRKGVCSTFLADRVVAKETRVGIFVHSNKAFRPPSDGKTPMIMVGPGTGVAPFRAFLHDRRAAGATGKTWLFFGDQRSTCDFLYRSEIESMLADGSLTRLSTAFSRDQAEKIYVQQRMLENADELFAWLEAGAHFYVCGDASRMAKDVDAALHRIIEKSGGKTSDQAVEYIQQLKAAKRYQRDVY